MTFRLFTCRACRRLFNIDPKTEARCPFCGSDRIGEQGRR